MFDRIVSALVAALVCSAGGAVFYFLHTPLPWMLGSLTASGLLAIAGGRWFLPPAARGLARPVVGVLAGSAFTADVVASAPGWWDAILVVVAQGLAVMLIGYVFYRRAAGYDRQTAMFSATPGGLGEMALLGASLGGDVRVIVMSQTLRIVLVLFAMPVILQFIVGHPIGRTLPTPASGVPPVAFDWAVLALCALAGYILGRVTKFSAGLMIFPLLLSASVHATGVTGAVPPAWLVALVQIAIGGVVGARFAGIRWGVMANALAFGAVWAVAMVALTAATAYGAASLLGRSFAAMILALAPGGTVEMTILTLSIGIEVAFVATCQVMRILCVLLLTPMVFNLIARNRV